MSAEPAVPPEWLAGLGQRAGLSPPGTEPIAEPGGNWRDRLIKNQKGSPIACLQNALVALEHGPDWQGVLHFNESALHVVAKAAPPWDSRTVPFVWRDDDDVRAAAWMQRQGIMVSKEIAGQAIQTIAREFPFHPIREYLNGLVWDKIPRINDWLTLYIGVDPSEYARAVGAKWLIGAVARIFQPGCKNDTCLVLEGPQGLLKSTALRTLAHPWFTDEIADLGTKDAALQVRGVWIIELAELDAMGRPEASRTKAFMSRSTDRYRPPYGRHLVEVPRESVFAGTVNHDAYLKDETGGRRFWPVECGTIRIDELRRDRDQLWAEALVRFRARETWWIDSAELSALAAEEQERRYDEDAWQPLIEKWVEGREHVTLEQILRDCLDKQPRDWTHGDKTRVARCLRAIGWMRKRAPKDDQGRREWRYCPGPGLRSAVPLTS
ncbi:MAG TPA: virulence-associated E family protein [Bryobacteraceae bacterium]|nr:virulence-associated E family protein [Bryobacteraceae bacterium]HXJ38724.1 virulence-associated E family protein [Bryobacteraceae bacterium]